MKPARKSVSLSKNQKAKLVIREIQQMKTTISKVAVDMKKQIESVLSKDVIFLS